MAAIKIDPIKGFPKVKIKVGFNQPAPCESWLSLPNGTTLDLGNANEIDLGNVPEVNK